MAYKTRSTFKSDTAADFNPGTDKWTGQEVEDAFINIADSAQWIDTQNTLLDSATVTFDVSVSTNATVTLGGNRTLVINSARAGEYYTLVVIQDGTGGRSLTLPAGKSNGGSLNTAAAGHSIITIYYNGSTYYYAIGQFS